MAELLGGVVVGVAELLEKVVVAVVDVGGEVSRETRVGASTF